MSYPKKTKCKICKQEYVKNHMNHLVCGYECSIEYAKKQQEKREAKKKSENRRALRQWKQSDKSTLKELAQKTFNAYIRLRDKDLPCVSCGTTKQGIQYHASHFKPVGGYSALRFNEKNVHKSCYRCNTVLSGNLVPYREELIRRIGLEEVEKLEQPNQLKDWKIDELQDIIKTYKQKIKDLKDEML